jgi:exonuclease VII small subunit
LEKGANIKASDYKGNTPLFGTIIQGYTDIVKLLIEKGADIDVENEYRETPLAVSIQNGHTDIASLLIEKGASIRPFNTPDSHGITDIQRFARNGNLPLLRTLLNKSTEEINPNIKNNLGPKMLEACRAQHNIEDLESLDINTIDFSPLTVTQNFCQTLVKLKDGSLLELSGVAADEALEFILKNKYPDDYKDRLESYKSNVLTTYLSPGHGFVRLASRSQQYYNNRGFYPRGDGNRLFPEELPNKIAENLRGGIINSLINASGYKDIARGAVTFLSSQKGSVTDENWYERHSEENNHLKLRFFLNDEQAKQALQAINKVSQSCSQNPEEACVYHLTSRNCVDFVQEVYKATGSKGYFADYFTDEQLTRGVNSFSPAELYEYKAMCYGYLQSRGVLDLAGPTRKELSELKKFSDNLFPPVDEKLPEINLSNAYELGDHPLTSSATRPGGVLFDGFRMVREYISSRDTPKAEPETRFTMSPGFVSEVSKLPITIDTQHKLAKVAYKLVKDTVNYVTDIAKELRSEKVSKKDKEKLVLTLEKELTEVVKTLEAVDQKLDREQVKIEKELKNYDKQSSSLLGKISKDKPIHKWLDNKIKEQKLDIDTDKKKLKEKTDKSVDLRFDHMKLEDKLAKLKESGELSKHSYDKISQAKEKLNDSIKGLKDQLPKPGKKPNGKGSPSQGRK